LTKINIFFKIFLKFLKIGIGAMTKTVQVYNILKEFIFKNQILPGERIYLENLSAKLNSSPTPLREALNRLVQEGYFSHSSNRGYTLRVIANSDVEK